MSRNQKILFERWVEKALWLAGVFSTLAVLGILAFLLYFCGPIFRSSSAADIFNWDWRPFEGHFGILPMIVGSLSVSLLALALAFPVAVGICSFAHGLARPWLGKIVLGVVHFMTSIPTIVYAFVSAIVLVPLMRDLFSRGSGFSLFAAAIVLSVLILPTIVLLIHVHWQGMKSNLHIPCAALGFNRSQEIFWVLIPASSRALAVAAILGFGRAIGDTMISLLLAGNAPQLPDSFLDSIRTLTAHIALVVATDPESSAYHSVFACGLILLLITAVLNLAARWLYSLSREK
jgi:phosphate transport system permease protein